MDTGDLSSLLGGVLENPDVMKKILGALSGTQSESGAPDGEHHADTEEYEVVPAPQPPSGAGEGLAAAMGGLAGKEAKNRRRLISALEPYLGEQRRDVAQKLLLIMEVISAGGMLK